MAVASISKAAGLLRLLRGAVLTATAVAIASAPSLAQVSVVAGHPRLYLRPEGLDALRARAASTAIAPYYQELKSRMDGSSGRHTNDEVSGFELESLALLHVVEASSLQYRDKALDDWVRWGYSAGGISHWALPYQVMGHALVLDWMWDDLSVGQRSDLGGILVTMMDELLAYAPHDLGPDPSWANQMSDYSNQLYFHLGALAFAGVALSGEGIDDARAQLYLDEAENLLHNHMIPAMNQEAGGDGELLLQSGFAGQGGWGEDLGHTGMTHPLFGRMVEAWRTGTGEDLFPRLNGLATISQYLVYLTRPGGHLSPKGNLDYTARAPDKSFGTLGCLTSARYGDVFGKHVKDTTHTGTTYGFHQLGAVLWYDPTLPALDLGVLPPSRHFPGQGEVVVRSGFDPQSTWVYLRSGPIYNGHQHDDQGNLLVEGYGGELLVENAGNGLDPTVNHNTIRIGGDQIAYGNNELQYAQPIQGTPQERGRVTAYTETPQYTYVATDFSDAYGDAQVAPPKAGKVTREVVTILPDLLVVRDRVAGELPAEVLWHTWSGASSVSGAEVTITRDTGRAWLHAAMPTDAGISRTTQGGTDLLTVTAATAQSPQTFLHLIVLSPAADPYTPAPVDLIAAAAEEGVGFSDRDGARWEVVFDPDEVGLVAVRNDQAAPSYALTASDCVVTEGDAGTQTCVFEVTLTPVVP